MLALRGDGAAEAFLDGTSPAVLELKGISNGEALSEEHSSCMVRAVEIIQPTHHFNRVAAGGEVGVGG